LIQSYESSEEEVHKPDSSLDMDEDSFLSSDESNLFYLSDDDSEKSMDKNDITSDRDGDTSNDELDPSI
jgi:hypothetical protein